MKYYFVINPAAGSGSASTELVPKIEKAFSGSGMDYEIHITGSKEDARSFVLSRAQEGKECRFYACGGDGTINDVACAMVGFPNAQLGVIPCGSGNDFVRNFTGRENFLDIGRQINAHCIRIDLIKYNDTYSVNMLNIGMDCDIVAEVNSMEAGMLKGPAAYLLGALKVLPKHKYYRMNYELDGVSHEKTLMLAAVGNGGFCGGGFHSCPTSSLSDGLMDVCIVSPIHGLKLLQMLAEYKNGKHLEDPDAEKYVDYFRCSSFTLTPLEPVRVSVDGEVSYFESCTFENCRQAITLAIPEGSEVI